MNTGTLDPEARVSSNNYLVTFDESQPAASPSPPVASTPASSVLAATGFDGGIAAVGALITLVVGLVALRFHRRRRTYA